MKQEVNRGEGATMEPHSIPVAAHSYFLQIMQPQHRERLSLRNAREIRTWCICLDLLAQGKLAQAADIGSQRLKALEKATVDGHWELAQYLELVPAGNTTLLENHEERSLAQEVARDRRLGLAVKGNWSGNSKGSWPE
eukprot:6460247-Amphidinium_carterae.2